MNEQVASLRDAVESTSFVAVLLFGSLARGDQTRTSDVDLLVVLRDSESARRIREWLRLNKLSFHPLILSVESLLHSEDVYPSFLAHILEEGKPLDQSEDWPAIRSRVAKRIDDPRLLDRELEARSQALKHFARPESFRQSPVTALSHLYRIGRSAVIVQLLRRGIHEYSWRRAFDEYAALNPDLRADVEAIKELRPYYDFARRRPHSQLPREDVSVDDLKRLTESVVALTK